MEQENAAKNGMRSVFDFKITLGNLVEIVVLIVAMVLAYGKLQSNIDVMWVQVNESKETIKTLKAESVRNEVYNLQVQTINEKLSEIQNQLKEIKHEVTK